MDIKLCLRSLLRLPDLINGALVLHLLMEHKIVACTVKDNVTLIAVLEAKFSNQGVDNHGKRSPRNIMNAPHALLTMGKVEPMHLDLDVLKVRYDKIGGGLGYRLMAYFHLRTLHSGVGRLVFLIQYNECIKDCDKAVERGRELRLDYKMARALRRKGTALVKMAEVSKYSEPAIKTFQKALTQHRNPNTLKKLNDAERAKKELEQQEYYLDIEIRQLPEGALKTIPNISLCVVGCYNVMIEFFDDYDKDEGPHMLGRFMEWNMPMDLAGIHPIYFAMCLTRSHQFMVGQRLQLDVITSHAYFSIVHSEFSMLILSWTYYNRKRESFYFLVDALIFVFANNAMTTPL
ncbi:HSP70-HSP90 organizing protein 3-like protein [Tanacetum coccineum]|uniref:HSP70-HSP90 organizing protein 3-like protein n=1 Tax=Tanacetum coccineum TaxID=301880 RepID=A0ABQ5I0A9_9ASTR